MVKYMRMDYLDVLRLSSRDFFLYLEIINEYLGNSKNNDGFEEIESEEELFELFKPV